METCAEVNNDFIEFAQLLPSYVTKEIQADNFYNTAVEKEDFKNEAGRQYTYPIYGRGVVVGDAFANFTEIPATGSTCDRPTQEIKFGAKNGSVTPRHYSQQTELLCLSDLIYKWDVKDQLQNTLVQMAGISRFTWSQEYQNVYILQSGNKIIANADRTSATGATFPAVAATSTLTWGLLYWIYQKLVRRYGGKGHAGKDGDERPIFNLVGSSETFEALKLQDDNVRADMRWAFATDGAGNPLLSAPGLSARVAYRGWKFNTVDLPPRYNQGEAGAYEQVFPMKTVAGSNGSVVWDISEDWEQAEFEATVVYLSTVMKHLVVRPSNFNAGYQWSAAQNWAGEFTWNLNAKDKVCNPNGDKGWWQANYVWGAKALRADDLSYVIMHKRCPLPDEIYECGAVAPEPDPGP